MRRLPSLLAALVLLSPAIAWAKPPLWVAHGRGATITLFGSVHVLPHDLDWEPDTLKTALTEADELWFETPIDPAALLGATQLALKKGMLPADRTLSALLSDDGKARLRREEEALREESAKMFAVVLTNRNAAWVRTLMQRLQAPPPPGGRPARIVVVVGVGHLAGKDGVPELLRRQGIRVDGPGY